MGSSLEQTLALFLWGHQPQSFQKEVQAKNIVRNVGLAD